MKNRSCNAYLFKAIVSGSSSILLASALLPPTHCFGSGFQIPNQSVTAIGTAGAHIAHTPGPDSAYYNPANMSILPDAWQLETSMTLLYLPSIDYNDNRSPLLDGSSDSEMFLLPLIHLSSPDFNRFRFGFSLTSPYGLAKSWKQPYPAATSYKFSLDVIEANPTISYLLSDSVSLGLGLRFLYGDGEVENRATNPPFSQLGPLTTIERTVDGDDLQMGYNLALSYYPTPKWALAITYRSEVELELDGSAVLAAHSGGGTLANYSGPSSVKVALPAVFSLASSYTFKDITVELTWNRTFWSSFDELDFEYGVSLVGTIFEGYDQPVARNWKDSDAYRLGLTYKINELFTSTFGFAIDETPVPEATLGFDLPDSDSYMYSTGVQYHYSNKVLLALSYMYQHNTARSVTNSPSTNIPGIDGKFSNGGAQAITAGLIYTF